jgi:hypothetical protein
VPHVRGDPEPNNGRCNIAWELSIRPLTPELRLEQKGGLRIFDIGTLTQTLHKFCDHRLHIHDQDESLNFLRLHRQREVQIVTDALR